MYCAPSNRHSLSAVLRVSIFLCVKCKGFWKTVFKKRKGNFVGVLSYKTVIFHKRQTILRKKLWNCGGWSYETGCLKSGRYPLQAKRAYLPPAGHRKQHLPLSLENSPHFLPSETLGSWNIVLKCCKSSGHRGFRTGEGL